MLKDQWYEYDYQLLSVDEDGKLITDAVKVKYSDKEYTIADDGKSVTMKVDGVEYNVSKDESLANDNIVEKDGKYYIVSRELYTNIAHINKSKRTGDYYAKEDGTLAKNEWAQDERNYWHYYGADFKDLKGYQTINGKKYYFNKYGILITGWRMRVKNENFDGTREAGRNDNISKDKFRYYYGEDGVIKEGWVNSKGKWYYIYSDGLMATNTTTPDGYWVDKYGIWKL